MSVQTQALRITRTPRAFRDRVNTCYDFFDAIFPTCGWDDLTEGKYFGDPTLGYELAQTNQAEWLLDQVLCEKGSRILDVGCGNGRILAAAQRRGATAVGITISQPQVKRCRQRGLDARLLDYRDLDCQFPKRFDAVIANGSIEHFVSPDDVLADRDESLYADLFQRCLSVLDPESPSQRLATTVIHRHEQSPQLDRADLKTGPFAFRWGSPEFHYALLQRSFGGWYPELHQLERCAAPAFALIYEEDGTQDYCITSEACFKRVRQRMFHWRHGPDIWKHLIGQFVRHPKQSMNLAICMFIAESWQWQFRGPEPPTRLLRQVWRAQRVPSNDPAQETSEESTPTLDIVQEASEESFPASDAPSWTPVTSA